MARPRNSKADVFKVIDMADGDNTKCWLYQNALNAKGLPYFTYNLNGTRFTQLAYRVVYELVHGVQLKTKEYILHSCDTPACCNPAHLRVGTHQENMNDMKERQRHGTFNAYMVRHIRKLFDPNGPHKRSVAEIAELYGVPIQVVRDLLNRVTYRHIKDEDEVVTNIDEAKETVPNDD